MAIPKEVERPWRPHFTTLMTLFHFFLLFIFFHRCSLTPKPQRNISPISFNHWSLAPKRFQFIKGPHIFRPAAPWWLAKDKVETDELYVVFLFFFFTLPLRRQGHPILDNVVAALSMVYWQLYVISSHAVEVVVLMVWDAMANTQNCTCTYWAHKAFYSETVDPSTGKRSSLHLSITQDWRCILIQLHWQKSVCIEERRCGWKSSSLSSTMILLKQRGTRTLLWSNVELACTVL